MNIVNNLTDQLRNLSDDKRILEQQWQVAKAEAAKGNLDRAQMAEKEVASLAQLRNLSDDKRTLEPQFVELAEENALLLEEKQAAKEEAEANRDRARLAEKEVASLQQQLARAIAAAAAAARALASA